MSIWNNNFKHPIDYLLTEALGYLLLETGDRVVLEQTGSSISLWVNRTPKN